VEDEDRGFFILVLGVLAAIVMLVSWWYTERAAPSASLLASRAVESAERTLDPLNDVTDATETTTADSTADSTADEDSDSTEADAEDTEAASEAQAPTVFDSLAQDPELSVLTALLREQGLDTVLAGEGPFTLFAPSNDAISAAAGSETALRLLNEQAESVLGYHAVPGVFGPEELLEFVRGSRQAELQTVQGETIDVAIDADRITLNGTTTFEATARTTGNGVVYVIDTVLIPPVASLNTIVSVEPILFASGSADIDATSFTTLDQLIEVLQGTTTLIRIEGHTDDEGDELVNLELSANRARAVLNYLVANGIDAARLSAEGFGSSRPRADNATDEGRALNRRIEFTLG
jgi:outer membrane protein OmpA-like peptidoglycan-associated protein